MQKNPKVQKGKFKVKKQGTVKYATIKDLGKIGGPKPGMGKGKSRGGGAAIRGTDFEGIF